MSDVGRYRKIFPRLWCHPQFLELSEGERLLTLYCLTGPQQNRCGYAKFSISAAAEDLDISPVKADRQMRRICSAFGWEYDRRRRVLFIPSWWTFNCPENPNVMIGVLKDLAEVPPSDLFARFAGNVETLPPTYRETFTQRIGEPSPKQEQEQEPEQEQDSPARTSRLGADEGFDRFWAAFPKKKAKVDAARAFSKVKPDSIVLDAMLASLERQKNSQEWLKDDGRFIPHAATWLRGRRWEDEPETSGGGGRTQRGQAPKIASWREECQAMPRHQPPCRTAEGHELRVEVEKECDCTPSCQSFGAHRNKSPRRADTAGEDTEPANGSVTSNNHSPVEARG